MEYGQKCCGLLGYGTLKYLMNCLDFLHGYANSGKLKITLIVISWVWSNMVMMALGV